MSSTPPLSGLTSRPYRITLTSTARPSMIISTLDHQTNVGVLWGRWFGGGVMIFSDPMIAIHSVSAQEIFEVLEDLPAQDPENCFDGVGGGWLTCLGYASGSSSASFYDTVLRWSPTGGWSFESLGLTERAGHDRRILARWRATLAAESSSSHSDPESDGNDAAPMVGAFGLAVPEEVGRRFHLAAVEAAIGAIHRGDLYQVNLCTRLYAEVAEPSTTLFARVAAELDPDWGGLIVSSHASGAPRAVASFSPELFLSVDDQLITTSPIKGTAPRAPGTTDSPELRASTKDAAENVMIVDLMRNDLSRVCQPGTVTVEELLGMQPHAGVWHLVSTVTGKLLPHCTTSDLLSACFPPGSVTGAPKIAAQRAIAQLEAQPRGAYTGALGLITPGAGSQLNVIIRSFEIADGKLELGVGGGITADSVPIREWYECLDKAAPLVAAVGSSLEVATAPAPAAGQAAIRQQGIFESVLVVGGRILRLAGHLARLDRSTRELYRRGLPEDLAGRIASDVGRQSLAERRAVRIEVRPDPASGDLRISLGHRVLPVRLTSSTLRRSGRESRSWRHKWLDRSSLEFAEREVAPALPYFAGPDSAELITETSRGNLFVLDGHGSWTTPVADEHLLPGVTRREVIDLLGSSVSMGSCSVEQLRCARAAFWTSSLSGAVSITSVDDHPLRRDQGFMADLNARLGMLPVGARRQ